MMMRTQTTRAAKFDAAHAEFERLRAIERAIGEDDTAQEAAVSATDAAFDAMIAIPATDAPRVAAKLQAVSDQYDLCASGMDRAVFAVVQAEIMAVLIPDAAIIAAWERRQKAFAAYNAMPDDNQPVIDGYGPGERELWTVIDAAEAEIRSATATTARGAMIQLSCAVFHSLSDGKDVEAFERGDIAAVEASDKGPPDWSGRLTLAALRSLMTMEAASC